MVGVPKGDLGSKPHSLLRVMNSTIIPQMGRNHKAENEISGNIFIVPKVRTHLKKWYSLCSVATFLG